MTEKSILDALDHSNHEYYGSFVSLGHPYSYLIDARLNAFRDDNGCWAIAVERLGYNPRAGVIELEIHYYGNCLINLDHYAGKQVNTYFIFPIDADNLAETLENECIKPNASYWLVRGQRLPLSHNKQAYIEAGIALKEYQPGEIRAEEAGRLLVLQHSDLFRASDAELYRCIPHNVSKIWVLDEWFHKDFTLQLKPSLTESQLHETYELNRQWATDRMGFGEFVQAIRRQEAVQKASDTDIWENCRPSSYKTWQLIAKVITTKDPAQYKPTMKANTHWSHWPESGSL